MYCALVIRCTATPERAAVSEVSAAVVGAGNIAAPILESIRHMGVGCNHLGGKYKRYCMSTFAMFECLKTHRE